MNILFITLRSDPGGGPKHLELLVRNISKKYNIFIASPEDEPFYSKFNEASPNPVFILGHRKFSFIKAFELIRYCKQHQIDIIHSHGKGAGVYGRVVKAFIDIKHIHTPHGIHTDKKSILYKPIYLAYEHLTSKLMDIIIYVSDDEHKKANIIGIWKSINYYIINNGIDPKDYPIDKAQVNETTKSKSHIVSVTRFDKQKNLEETLLIASLLPDLIFTIVGDGPTFGFIKNKAQQLKLNNVRLIGYSDEPQKYLSSADIYLTSSLWEGLPFSVIEALSFGLPIIASDTEGHREIVSNCKCGNLYRLGHPDEAASLISNVIYDKNKYKKYSINAQEFQINNYSHTTMIDKTCKIYESLHSFQ